MKIAVLSGKGGTGKTLISVNLAAAAQKSIYIDCDVEEPNGHLFFKPINLKEEKVLIKIPKINDELCNGCRKCVEFCNFNALAYVGGKLHIFNEVCHSCGGCILICPPNALSEKNKIIGIIERGISDNVTVNTGILKTGEASGVPIIRELLKEKNLQDKIITFIDCPPGSACIVMESIKNVDYCVLVAEPTLFGVHNLNMVYKLVQLFNKPCGVILNKCTDGINPAKEYCQEKNINILSEIPFDSKLGIINSNAHIAVRENNKYLYLFNSLLQIIIKETLNETTANS